MPEKKNLERTSGSKKEKLRHPGGVWTLVWSQVGHDVGSKNWKTAVDEQNNPALETGGEGRVEKRG